MKIILRIFFVSLVVMTIAFNVSAQQEVVKKLYERAVTGDTVAIEQLKRHSDNGDRDSQSAYGRLLIRGTGVEKDETEGVKWSREAALQGSVVGLRDLAYACANGLGGRPKSIESAALIYYFLKVKGVKSDSIEAETIKLSAMLSPGEIDRLQLMAADMRLSHSVVFEIDKIAETSKNIAVKKAALEGGLSPDGYIWTDRRTGLMWSVCHQGVGVILSESIEKAYGPSVGTCRQDPNIRAPAKQPSWHEAFEVAQKSTLGGFNDWRIPTMKEMATVTECWKNTVQRIKNLDKLVEVRTPFELSKRRNNSAYECEGGTLRFVPQIRGGLPEMTSSSGNNYGLIWANDHTGGTDYLPRILFDGGIFRPIENDAYSVKNMSYLFRLVRGGNASAEWIEAGKDAERVRLIFRDEADQFKKSIEAHDKRAKELQEKNTRQEEEYTAWYQSEAKRLRAGVKKGDVISKGTVLEVRGDQINVQTTEYVCTEQVNPATGRCNVFSLKKTFGNAWIARSQVYPKHKDPSQFNK